MLRFVLCAAALVACSGGIDRSAFDLNVCTSGSWDPLAGIALADPNESLELVEADDASSTVLSTHGTPCAAASDVGACKAALAAATTAAGWEIDACGGAGCRVSRQFFVAESAGVVRVIDDVASLGAELAPVDSAANAVLLADYAHAEGYPPAYVDCTQPQALARADGSFDVFLATGDGDCSDRVEEDVAVFPDGTTALLQQTVSPAKKQCLLP